METRQVGIPPKPPCLTKPQRPPQATVLGWIVPGKYARCGGTGLRLAPCHESGSQHLAHSQYAWDTLPRRSQIGCYPHDHLDASPRQPFQSGILASPTTHSAYFRVRLEKIFEKAHGGASSTRRLASRIRWILSSESRRGICRKHNTATCLTHRLAKPSRKVLATQYACT